MLFGAKRVVLDAPFAPLFMEVEHIETAVKITRRGFTYLGTTSRINAYVCAMLVVALDLFPGLPSQLTWPVYAMSLNGTNGIV